MNKFIFDFGGVVVRWSMDGVMNSINRPSEEKEKVKAALFHHNDWQLMDQGTLTHEQVIQNSATRSGLSIEIIELFFYTARSYVTPVEEVYELLCRIKSQGYKLYGLSNMSENFYQCIKDYPAFKLFDGILWSYQDKLIKPNKEIWLTLLERYNLTAEECVFIDDMDYNIQAAKALGFQTVHFTGLDKIGEVERYLVKA